MMDSLQIPRQKVCSLLQPVGKQSTAMAGAQPRSDGQTKKHRLGRRSCLLLSTNMDNLDASSRNRL